ncbi:MAG: gamma-glutamyltransferase family protein [Gemmatimonadales bacterium]|nr:MAG: gamma-glutamyltransferase family protein [Gemmatimonadales bacterium]
MPFSLSRFGALFAAGTVALAACAPAETADRSTGVGYEVPVQPEIATGYQEKPGWTTSEFAVAAANPLATDAGYQVLVAGGTAVDAAIAVQMVLTLVEPQSSGIGGGAFLMNWDGSEIAAYDGREVAPAGADENLFIRADGSPYPFSEARASGLSVGVPGLLAMLEVAHAAHGRLPWADLFTPAITLAEQGFSLSPRLNLILEEDTDLRRDPIARALYYDEDLNPHPVGYNLRNPALAAVLRQVADEGVQAFYHGAIAEDIEARVQGHPERPGTLRASDLAAYPEQDFGRDAICTPWRDWTLCGFPPPSSGHLAVMQMLGILDHLEAAAGEGPGPDARAGAPGLEDGIPSAEWLHRYLEAAKLAFADRARFVGDGLFVDPPARSWESLLDPDYLASRAELVGSRSMGTARAGNPGALSTAFGLQPTQPEAGTSHISIVDADGNAVSMTTTIESGFGARIMSDGGTGLPGGFHLNNELTDFSLTPRDADGLPLANRVEAGKRPRSSMTPTLVFDRETGAFVATVGSPGGAAIIHYVAKALVGMLAWDLNAQEAINLPNFTNSNGPSTLEAGRFPDAVIEALRARGHEIREGDLTSGLQGIQVLPGGGFFGGADPRREGVVMGR